MLHTSIVPWLGVTAVGVVALLLLAARSRRYGDQPGGLLFTTMLLFVATEPRGTIVTIRFPIEGPEADALEVPMGRLPSAGS